MNLKKCIFKQKCVQCARKGIFYPFLHIVNIFVIFLFFFIHVDQKYTMWDFSLKHSHIFLKILILDCKVFKLKRFSSSKLWFQKKGVTDLTSAQTSKVCCTHLTYVHTVNTVHMYALYTYCTHVHWSIQTVQVSRVMQDGAKCLVRMYTVQLSTVR